VACATNPSLSTVKGMVEFTDESLKGWRVGTEIFSGVQVGDLPFVLFGLDDDTTSSASSGSVVLSLSSGLLLSPELTLPASSGSLLLLVVTLALSASLSSTLMSISRTFLTHCLKKAANFFGLMMYKGGLAL